MSEPEKIGERMLRRALALGDRVSAHATDPEPRGPIPDVDLWLEGNWRRVIPLRFRDARLHQVDPEAADLLRMWVDVKDERPNLIIAGCIGSGKTHAAVAVLRELHQQGQTIGMWSVTTLTRCLMPSYPDAEETMEAAVAVDALLLDDLGIERGTDWVNEQVYELLNRRWTDRVPTIVTSNLSPDKLAVNVGQRVWSRICQDATAVALMGPDRRQENWNP